MPDTEEVVALRARIAELERALKELQTTAVMLLQNSEGCAANHYGDDIQIHGMPGWLVDCRKSIDHAASTLKGEGNA